MLPSIVFAVTRANFNFGGTSLLIVVGVALETMKQIEAQLMMRNYEGFLKSVCPAPVRAPPGVPERSHAPTSSGGAIRHPCLSAT